MHIKIYDFLSIWLNKIVFQICEKIIHFQVVLLHISYISIKWLFLPLQVWFSMKANEFSLYLMHFSYFFILQSNSFPRVFHLYSIDILVLQTSLSQFYMWFLLIKLFDLETYWVTAQYNKGPLCVSNILKDQILKSINFSWWLIFIHEMDLILLDFL